MLHVAISHHIGMFKLMFLFTKAYSRIIYDSRSNFIFHNKFYDHQDASGFELDKKKNANKSCGIEQSPHRECRFEHGKLNAHEHPPGSFPTLDVIPLTSHLVG